MSRLDELPPDQRATLALVLTQGKSYAQVAAMLGISERAVHDRAHSALAVLAPAKARGLTAEQREDIGEHLLGEQTGIADRLRTRTLLDGSEPARAWAQALVKELAPIANDSLPEIPSGAPAPGPPTSPDPAPGAPAASAPDSPPPAGDSLPSSRAGGALVLAAIVVAVVVAVVLISGGGSTHRHHMSSSTTSTGTATGPAVTARIELRSPSGASRSLGLLQVLTEGSKRAFYVVAEHLPASGGFFYALWLYNNPSSREPLGRAPTVGSSHRLEGGGALPANAGEFHEVLLTRETSPRPSQPGHVVLRGQFTLG